MQFKLVKKLDEAKGTKTFVFRPNEKINFEAGQYIYITLPKLNYPDARGETRHFTISNSPTEGDDIKVTTRMREESGYKKTLDELSVGTVVEGRGPQGFFVLPTNNPDKLSRPPLPQINLFIAGGIGITPFRSMIKYAIDSGLSTPIYLIYSNSDSDFVFKKELDTWQKEYSNLKIEYIDTSVDGRIDEIKLKKLINQWNLVIVNFTAWVVGPNPFVDAVEELLVNLNISEDNIKSEKFTGY
ncbi:MAG: FAD-dependent oxidoreductase [bacterium]|nr:MAG: FAD-dependent oxidoreductase [bacterium]